MCLAIPGVLSETGAGKENKGEKARTAYLIPGKPVAETKGGGIEANVAGGQTRGDRKKYRDRLSH